VTDRERHDLFAAAALKGLLAGRSHEERNVTVDLWAAWAVQLADAMLAAPGNKPAAQAAAAPGDAGEDVPGGGFRWVKPGEALQAGDQIKQVRMSGTTWLACARVGRVVTNGDSFTWRRRITTADDAAPAATASEASPPAAGLTLTDAEIAFLELHCQRLVWWAHSSDDSKRELVTARGLLARAAKEATR
jgi:hypothetical protein